LELIGEAGADIVGIDWRTTLADARRRLGPDVALQGNLDPIALLASWHALRDRAQAVLDDAGNAPGHIFNLGHGVLPQVPVDNVRRLVDYVHTASAR
jgi:uroporphyrinogen decarboxylase